MADGPDMIDSSGRRALSANGTILDLVAVERVILLAGLLLVALFTVVKPEASNGLGTMGRLVFWSLHVGLGLGAIWVASYWLSNRQLLPGGTLPAILVTGCAGIVVAVIGYLVLDRVYAPYIVDLDPDPPAGSLVSQLLDESLELAPWFMVAWLLINLPVLLPRPEQGIRLDDSARQDADSDALIAETPATDPATEEPVRDRLTDNLVAPEDTFLLSLPGVVGTDIVAVSSDLHYLNVWTVAGRTTVLGNLKDVVNELGDTGMQVHRSHWVAHAHVKRIVGTAKDAACILSNELRVPISRRRWKSVREQYGRGVIHGSTVE